MIKNSLIVIPFNLPWEWSTDYTNQTAMELAKNGNKVICYMWTDAFSLKEYFEKKKFPKILERPFKNLYLYHPILFVPFRRFLAIEVLNEIIDVWILKGFMSLLALRNIFEKKIFWVFDPRLVPFLKYFSSPWKIIYDCVDLFSATARNKEEKKSLVRNERKLLIRADLVTANSEVLVNYLKNIRNDVFLVPQGFRINTFLNKTDKSIKIKRGDRPLIGYVGAVNCRLNYSLLYELARRNPDWDFAIWGPVLQKELFTNSQSIVYDKLIKLDNVILGQSSKLEIPSIINQFDIGMIPYDVTQDFNKYCYPMKLFEYFYLGKPVVSTKVEELKRFPKFVKIGNDYMSWKKIISDTLSRPWPSIYKSEQRAISIENTWGAKLTKITGYMEWNRSSDENIE